MKGGLQKMVTGIVSGAEGVGKTTQLLEIAKAYPPARVGLMELKDNEKVTSMTDEDVRLEMLYKTYPPKHELQGNDNPFASLDAVKEWIKSIYSSDIQPATIIIDGISNIRRYATYAWILEDNTERVSKGSASRKTIGSKNLAAWGEINMAVQEIITPLITFALQNGVNLFMTAQMRDLYRDGDVVGTVPDIKPFMSYSVPCLFQLSYNGSGYCVDCTKAPENPQWHEERIQKGTGFLDALIKHKLIDPPVQESNYMITYKLDGEKKRAFVKAETEADAQNEFTRGYPGCTFLEVVK